MPDFCNSSIESGEYMSSLDRSQTIAVQLTQVGAHFTLK